MEIQFNSLTVIQGIHSEPRVTLDTISTQPFQALTETNFDVNGLKGFITEVQDTTLYGILIDGDKYNEVKSMYLGDSLLGAITSLNIKPLVEHVPDLNQKFFRFNESAWDCLCRLMSYMPSNFYWYCTPEAIEVIEAPSEFTPFYGSNMKSSVINNRFIMDGLISESKYNPSYHSIYSVPVNKLAADESLFSTDMINNNLQNYKNRGLIYQNTMKIVTMDNYDIGKGLSVNGVNYMVASAACTYDKNMKLHTNIYSLIGV